RLGDAPAPRRLGRQTPAHHDCRSKDKEYAWVTFSMEIGLGALPLLVDRMSGHKPVKAILCGRLMWPVGCEEMCKAPSSRRRCLEAAIAPAGVEIETFDW